jgi:hypothetical protein
VLATSAQIAQQLMCSYNFSFLDQIKVLVSKDKKQFMVHKNEICSRSEFFATACSKRGAKPNETAPIKLLEDSSEIFDILLIAFTKIVSTSAVLNIQYLVKMKMSHSLISI